MTLKRILTALMAFMVIGGGGSYAADKKEAAKPPMQITPGAKTAPEEKKEEPPKVLIRVNEAEIDELDMLGMVNTLVPGAVVHGSISEKKQKEIRKNAIERLVVNELMNQEARKQGITVKKKEIEQEIKELKKRLKKNKTTLEDTLKKNKLTMEGLEKEVEKNLYISKITINKNEEFKSKASALVTDAFMEEYYNENKEKFKEPERIRLREILIKADPGGGQKAWNEARARSEEILKEIKAGKDFAQLAKEFSQDIYAAQGGDMGFAHKGSIMAEIEDVADKLKIGEAAGPIWSLYGYHIIKLEEKAPPIQRTFEEVKANIKADREKFAFQRLRVKWIGELKKKAKIEYMNQEDRELMESAEKKPEKGEQQKN